MLENAAKVLHNVRTYWLGITKEYKYNNGVHLNLKMLMTQRFELFATVSKNFKTDKI